MAESALIPPRPLVLATAWWIAAELVRRHPLELTVIETHPGGGQSDCLAVYKIVGDDAHSLVHMNHETGACHLHGPRDLGWPEAIMARDRRRDLVELYESAADLLAPSSTPAARPTSIGIRAISAFMERVALAVRVRWIMENGVLDSAGYEGGVRREHFQALPMAQRQLEELRGDPGPLGLFEYRFWFLLPSQGEKPVLAIDQHSGLAWDQDREYDLLQTYKDVGRSMDRLVSTVFPPAF